MTLLHGFELLRDTEIPEIRVRARLYRHAATGAELLSLENDDENKVFGVAFHTPPTDSTGVPHIMEHAVLGGSHSYPLKEPFVQLVKGSFKTFLNAMTGADRTLYPVASTNLQDFYNLVDVYLDAVFHPLITRHHLDQEGWRYDMEGAGEPLTFKGVVYNEMKGAYSSPDSLLYRASQHALFPDNAYRFDSGGDPRAIPDLTYEQFREFHARYYQPSNARFFFYGDDDPAERLRRIDSVIAGFGRQAPSAPVALQPPFAEPRRVYEQYGVDGSEGGGDANAPKTLMLMSWLLPESADTELSMGLSVLSYALIGVQASPLRKALTDSGLGEDVLGGLSSYLRQMTFSAGMKGLAAGAVDSVEALVLTTLEELAAGGFDPELIEAAVNSIEFSLRENNTGSTPRGLVYFSRALVTWLQGGDPLLPLAFETPLAAVKRNLQDERYLQELIRAHLLENSHRVTTVLSPDAEYNRRLAAEEAARLAHARARMDDAAVQAVVENTHLLRRLQETPDSPETLALLPRLTLADLEPAVKTIPLEVQTADGAEVLYHDLFTNGIVYLDLGFRMDRLPAELLPYANFFARALTEMGTESEDYVKLSQRIGRQTGGVGAFPFVADRADSPTASAWLFARGKATVAQAPALLAILRDILLTVKLDNRERFRQIVLKSKARLESSLTPAGHSYVDARLRAGYSAAGWAEERMDGIEYLFFVRRLAAQVESDWPGVLAALEAVRAALVNRSGMVANVTLDAGNYADFSAQLAGFLAELPTGTAQAATWPAALESWQDEGLTIPAQVNYVGKGANLYELGYRYHGSIQPIINYLRTGYLWEKIRAQGGAYGAMCHFSRHSGVLTLLSYRDPNLLRTLEVYDQAAGALRSADLSEDELTRSIIGAISSMDAYQLPDAKGFTSLTRYLLGDSDAVRQKVRDEVLAARPEDFRAFADVLDEVAARGRVAVLGSADALAAANEQRAAAQKTALKVTKVL